MNSRVSCALRVRRSQALFLISAALSAGSLLCRADINAPLPETDRFEISVLDQGMPQPLCLAPMDDGRVMFIELMGKVKIYHPSDGRITEAASFEVYSEQESGLLGIALDPDFPKNGWVYLNYSHPHIAEQWITRFVLRDDKLDRASETVILKFVTDRKKDNCCHEAGSMAFGPDGCLYISAGDNTNPFGDSNGYGPIDERPGRDVFDAQRTAGNSMDLRGAITRIRPKPEGGYSIPEGNLFPEGGPIKGRPEIYAKGCRNPWRISVDQKTGYLYWGDVGPDAPNDNPDSGSRGYDEINQARQAGYFGWPYFIADNQPYHRWDFAKSKWAGPFDPQQPANHSPNNTGSELLPPAQPAWIFYPPGVSDKFPQLGSGGRTACAGPVYHFDPKLKSEVKLPKYYDNCLFIYEWSRHWVMAVHLDEKSQLVRIEPFLKDVPLKRPVDLKFGPKGELYLLEYGDTWGPNKDSRLSRITYQPNNRPPVARASASGNIGKGPLEVHFSSQGSMDKDPGDSLRFEWRRRAGGQVESTEPNPTLRFETAGNSNVELTVIDRAGARSTALVPVLVGNTPPKIEFESPAPHTFFQWGKSLKVRIKVEDPEDDEILQRVFLRASLNHGNAAVPDAPYGLQLVRKSDCLNCHAVGLRIVGPPFADVAKKYQGDTAALDRAVERVIKGSTGVWGQVPMMPHPQNSAVEIRQMVQWVFSLASDQGDKLESIIPNTEAMVNLGPRPKDGSEANYVLSASYTDRGCGPVGPLSSTSELVLRNPRVEAGDCQGSNQLEVSGTKEGAPQKTLRAIRNGAWASYPQVNLAGINNVTCRASSATQGGKIEFRQGSITGKTLATVDIPATDSWEKFVEVSAPVKDPGAAFDLYLTFSGPDQMLNLSWFEFGD